MKEKTLKLFLIAVAAAILVFGVGCHFFCPGFWDDPEPVDYGYDYYNGDLDIYDDAGFYDYDDYTDDWLYDMYPYDMIYDGIGYDGLGSPFYRGYYDDDWSDDDWFYDYYDSPIVNGLGEPDLYNDASIYDDYDYTYDWFYDVYGYDMNYDGIGYNGFGGPVYGGYYDDDRTDDDWFYDYYDRPLGSGFGDMNGLYPDVY